MRKIAYILLALLLWYCKEKPAQSVSSLSVTTEENPTTDSIVQNFSTVKKDTIYHHDFVNLNDLSSDFVYEMKYATDDNFLKQQVYDCDECFLRKATAEALVSANQEFMSLGYRIKIYDCYRPLSVQRKMWAILPGTHYVANPAKGSKHNRGAAVDLTLIDADGNELDMGTPFDHFGKEAHHTYTQLPEQVRNNRLMLKQIMDKYNFRSIYSEWWHYEYRPERHAEVENFEWECE